MNGIVRTWATQLIRQNKTSLDLAFQMHQTRKTRRASRDDVWTILKDTTAQIHRCVLVLDGLDEFCSDDDRRRQFLCDLKHALQGTNARVLITSRTEFDIESGLRFSATEPELYSLINCNVSRHLVKDDIDLVSKSIVARKLPKQEQLLREELAVQMAERCDGQFLWLKLQQDLLRDSKSPKALRAVVQAMPQKLHALYQRSWSCIAAFEEPDRNRAIDTLRWLTFAYRPLSVQELAEALIVSLDQDEQAFSEEDLPTNIDIEYIDGEIKNLCGSLVELREDTENPGPQSATVRLVHASVRDFLVGKLPLPSLIGSSPRGFYLSTAQHTQLAAHCIRFLDCAETWVSNSQTGRSFTQYATDSWFRHLQDSGKDFGPIAILVNNLMRRGNPNFDKWKVLYEQRHESNARKPGTSFYYACLFGLIPAMDFLQDNEDHLDLNVRGGEYCTPLQAVCSTGNDEAFHRLITWKADVFVRGGQFGNAFNAAAYNNHIAILKDLIACGSLTRTLSTEMHGAITTAASQGHIEIVEFLLNQGANISLSQSHSLCMGMGSKCKTMMSWQLASPIHAATKSSHLRVVKLLVERGADVNERDVDGLTALHVASAENSPEIVELLLDSNVNPNVIGRHGGALHVAAQHGHLKIATLLVESKAILDLRDRFGWTPLLDAAYYGHVKVVENLCTGGANMNTQNSYGWTPLYCAAYNGHTKTAAYLIGEGVDVNFPMMEGMAALHIAIENGHSEMANLLIRAGANLNSTDQSLTPLHLAGRHGIPELIMPLIDAGADRDAQAHDGSTSLHEAAISSHLTVVDLLLESGAVIKADNEGGTPLHHAAFKGSLEIATRLLERGADLHAQDSEGATPLHAAAMYDNSNMVAFLLDQGSNIDAQTDSKKTALMIAICRNNPNVFDMLISRGADVNVVGRWGHTALHFAPGSKRMESVRSLVERGSDVNATSMIGTTPLRMAIERGSDEMIHFLIQSGAGLDIKDCYGMRVSDWLQRLRPNLQTSMIACEVVQNNSSGPDAVILRRTIVWLATKLKESVLQHRDLFILARGFIFLGMEDHAMLASQLSLLAPDANKVGCYGCKKKLNTVDPFFVCKTCPGIEICERCMVAYDNKGKDLKNSCCDHEFIRALACDAKFKPTDTEVFHGWLDRIVEQFRDN